MTRLRRAVGAITISGAAIVAGAIGPALPVAAQDTTSSVPSSTSVTTIDPTVETAPVIELSPADEGSVDAGTDDSDSEQGSRIVTFVSAIVIPLAGVAFLVWYARRMARAANARASASARRDEDAPAEDDDR